MTQKRLGIIMNGVTGRMGMNQHLIRSIVAIRAEGGVTLTDGTRVMPDPILVGRNAEKVQQLAKAYGIERTTTDLDAALRDKNDQIFFDAATTQMRPTLLERAIKAGKHIYCEKPIATNLDEAVKIAKMARDANVKNGSVVDKLFLPGLQKLRMLRDSGFFGRMIAVKGDFGYWVFEGDWQPAQRPSWNYRAQDGGGMVVDMFCHWSYVLENLFGRVEAVTAKAVTHIDRRWDERGQEYAATADDAAYGIFELAGGILGQINSSWAVRVNRDELVEFQVDGTEGSAVAGLFGCKIQHRAATPKAVWNPDLRVAERFRDQWVEVPDNREFSNGFKAQWEQFIRHVVDGEPHPYDFLAGARGMALAEAGLQSSAEGRRVTLPQLSR